MRAGLSRLRAVKSRLFLLSAAVVLGLAAALPALADDPPTTTAPAAPALPPVEPAPPAQAPPAPEVVAPHVSIGGLVVGGLDPSTAYASVQEGFATPLRLVVDGHIFSVRPSQLGASAYARGAVTRALSAGPGDQVKLVVAVHGAAVRSYVADLARRIVRKPVDARLSLQAGRPVIASDRPGRVLDRGAAVQAIVQALVDNVRKPVVLTVTKIEPKVKASSFRQPLVIIHRSTNELDLYRGMTLLRQFRVATGQSAYPTPLGHFEIVVRYRDPWWYPPASPWAQGLSPVPPGPGNPLGTRWMGLSAHGVGIHGTYEDGSIGYSLSHGCIRMHIPDAEWLFDRVQIGTPVFIVAA
jgi:lipoprotein-anchoring transpeptidase ErfK/SrfK